MRLVRCHLVLLFTVAVLAGAGPVGCGGGSFPQPVPSEDPEQPEQLGPGDWEIPVTHDGRDRRYLVRVPEGPDSARAVVLAFHGGGGNARQFRESNGWLEVAGREGVLLVHPDGTGRFGLHTWNVQGCCGYAGDQNVDDVGFVLALIDDLARRVPVDRDRVFLTGHSNGAMIGYRLAAEAAERFAGLVAVGGVREFERGSPIPILHIQSVDDPRALYDGGEGPPFPLTRRTVVHPATPDVLDGWARTNGCAGDPVVIEERTGIPGGPNAGQHAELVRWGDCPGATPLLHWRMHGVGHGWPGDPTAGERRRELLGPSTTLIDAADEGWRFFERW